MYNALSLLKYYRRRPIAVSPLFAGAACVAAFTSPLSPCDVLMHVLFFIATASLLNLL